MSEPHDLYAGLRFTYLLSDRYKFSRSWVYPESVVPYSLLRLIVSGEAVFTIDGVAHEVRRGDVVHIPEGRRLACRAISDDIAFISIRFISSVRLGDVDFLTAYYGVPPVSSFGDDAELEGLFQAILTTSHAESPSMIFTIRGTLELIVARLVAAAEQSGREPGFLLESGHQLLPRTGSTVRRDPRIEAVVHYLIHNPSAPVVVDHLCRLADLSPSSMRRLFKAHTGKTVNEFVTELRMMTAARMLIVTSDRVGDISQRLGFADQNYFTRMFRNTFGVSPREYRRSSREQQ